MSKKALAVTLKDLTAYFDANEKTQNYPKMRSVRLKGEKDPFFSLPTFLADRATCETDTSIVQLLPYITITHVDAALQVSVVVYKRGSKGTEERLRNSSIGYGGHVEEEVVAERGGALINVLTNCAVREIEEETGIVVPAWKIRDALSTATIFHDTSDESQGVGKFHLAISFHTFLSTIPEFMDEEGNVENSRFIGAGALMTQHNAGAITLEPWSRIVLGDLSHVK